MEIELQEVRDFIAEQPPFDLLSEAQLDALPRQVTVRYFPRGSTLPGTGAVLYLLRSGSIDIRNAQGDLLDKLDVGEICHQLCEQTREPVNLIASDDCLVYTLPCSHIAELRQTCPALEQFFTEIIPRSGNVIKPDMPVVAVRDLISRPPVLLPADSSIQQAASLMREHKISSLMLTEAGQLAGIVTDRDLRNRCLAEGVDPQQPVSRIMSHPVTCLDADTLSDDAILTMTRAHIHHIPVTDKQAIIGLITVTDLLKASQSNSALFIRDITRADNVEELAAISQRLPELQLQLVNQQRSARHIGMAISHITDAITQRLAALAEATLGPPPVPYVWVAGGSQARLEQSAHSDQDNALIISDAMQEQDADYFEALCHAVSDGLNACGYIYCPGDAMATNAEWRLPLTQWQKKFSQWIARPEPRSLMYASIFFDLRPVTGDSSLFDALQQHMLKQIHDNDIFIAYLAAHSVKHRPPLGIFRNLVLIREGEHKDQLDLKHRGSAPIIDIARLLALVSGTTETHTLNRLAAARDAGKLSSAMCDDLSDAFNFIGDLRMEHQAQQIRQGLPPDNYLSPVNLSGLERQHLKNAFHVIKTMQETLETRYQTGRFA